MVMMSKQGAPEYTRMIYPATTAIPLCGQDIQRVYGASKTEEGRYQLEGHSAYASPNMSPCS
jgi:hypothetical protein